MERIEDIRQAVRSALIQTYPRCEVIVAVDHNQPLLEQLEAELPEAVRLVLNTGSRGLSDTRNTGIAAAAGGIVYFMDDDAAAMPDCVERLAAHYGVPEVVAVGGRSIADWTDSRPGWFPEELDWVVGCSHKGAPTAVAQVRNLIGCNMSFRREVFEEAGLFNTELGRTGASGAGEETEICVRTRQRMPSAVILYEPGAIVHHRVPPQRATFRYLISRCFDGGQAVARIRTMYSSSKEASLATSTETAYLRYLLTTALLERIKHCYRSTSLAQMGAILLSVAATGSGYALGRVAGLRR